MSRGKLPDALLESPDRQMKKAGAMGAKYRHEYKYLISSAQAVMLRNRLDTLMQRDVHAGGSGIYGIRSLYFDDRYNRCFYENENGIDPREKFRIRIYNGSTDRIALECKHKERGMTQKTSQVVDSEFVNACLRGGSTPIAGQGKPLVERLNLEHVERGLNPVTIVEYDRIPYVYPLGNVRVTFDYNLCSSNEINRFLSGDFARRPVMPTGQMLLEVKFDEFLPDFIYEALSLDNLRVTAYSKYYLCRRYHL